MVDQLQNGTLRTIRQVKDSIDCGYFACYALMLVGKYRADAASISFCQNDVYRMRERRRSGKPVDPLLVFEHAKDVPNNRGLNMTLPSEATYFLSNTLKCPDYREYDSAKMTSQQWNDLLENNISDMSKGNGMLVNISRKHWVTILGKIAGVFQVYDPGRGYQTISHSALLQNFPNFRSVHFRGRKPALVVGGRRRIEI